VIMTPLEIKGAAAGVITSVLVLAATFTGGAAGFVLVHNHPCGDPRPSPADIELTERILKGARILALTFLDHVIVGRKIGQQPGYFSFQEAGLL